MYAIFLDYFTCAAYNGLRQYDDKFICHSTFAINVNADHDTLIVHFLSCTHIMQVYLLIIQALASFSSRRTQLGTGDSQLTRSSGRFYKYIHRVLLWEFGSLFVSN